VSTPNEQVPQPQYGQYAQQAAYAPPAYPPPVLKAPEGTKPYTVWIWLITIAIPLVSVAAMIPFLVGEMSVVGSAPTWARSQTPDAAFAAMAPMFAWMGLTWLIGLVMTGLMVLFAWLDHRELQRRGVPKPFHWAWSFFAFAGAGNLVTVIGRSIVVNRRVGKGLAPIWVTIAIYVAMIVVMFVIMGVMFSQIIADMPLQYGTYAPAGLDA